MRVNFRNFILAGSLSALAIALFYLSSAFYFKSGFPLDDAWIHQTYARNLIQYGEWAFVPGIPSAGSTSPFWTGLLAVGYVLRLPPLVWTSFLGWIALTGLSVTGMSFVQQLFPGRKFWILAAGVMLALEWHLVWAASSGMETLVFAALTLLSLVWLASGWEKWPALGMLIGLSVWVRPDGLTLLAPALFAIVLDNGPLNAKAVDGLKLLLGFSFLFALYLLFNRLTGGVFWPNTFYAKQAEYAAALSQNLIVRFAEQTIQPLTGVGVLLLPGFLYYTYSQIKTQSWGMVAGAIWAVGYLGLYAWRLPVTYQHGRYVIPMMPVYFLWGFAGVVQLLRCNSPHFWRRVISRGWAISLGLVLLGFTAIGARAFARDVAVIESEMVAAARWVAENTEPDALIAAHDIGALGYFGQRKIVDLAGLVSPEVIPFIRDEGYLRRYLDRRGTDYLVTFPNWYSSLVKSKIAIFHTGGKHSPIQGGENMIVYRWKSRP
jgi:arabinofuranosyltransferase